MASMPRSIKIEVYKLSKSHKNSQSSFTYVVKKETIGLDKLPIRQLRRWVGLFGTDIIGLAFRSSG